MTKAYIKMTFTNSIDFFVKCYLSLFKFYKYMIEVLYNKKVK